MDRRYVVFIPLTGSTAYMRVDGGEYVLRFECSWKRVNGHERGTERKGGDVYGAALRVVGRIRCIRGEFVVC